MQQEIFAVPELLQNKPRQTFDPSAISNTDFFDLLSTAEDLTPLLSKIPNYETLDTKTRNLLKKVSLKELSNDDSGLHAECCTIFSRLFSMASEKMEYFNDLLDVFTERVTMSDRKLELKRRSFFRSKSSTTYLTFTICNLL